MSTPSGRRVDKRQTRLIAAKIGQSNEAALSDDYSKGFSPAMVRGIFAGLDCDRDGVVTLPDLVTWFNTVLNRRETNKEDHAVKAAATAAARAAQERELTPFLAVASKGGGKGGGITPESLGMVLSQFRSLAFDWHPAPMPSGKQFRKLVELTFKELDADEDGEVTKEDFMNWQRKLPLGKLDGPALAARAMAADVTNDGSTELDELEVLVREDTLLFAQLDTQRRLNDWLRRHSDRSKTTPEEYKAAFVLASMRFSRYADEHDRRMLSEALLAKKIVALIDEDGNGGDGDGMVSVQELQRWLGRVVGLPVTEADLSLMVDPKQALEAVKKLEEKSNKEATANNNNNLGIDDFDDNGDDDDDDDEDTEEEEEEEVGRGPLSEEDIRSLLAEPALREFTSLLEISVKHELSLLSSHRHRNNNGPTSSSSTSLVKGPFNPPPPPPPPPDEKDLSLLFISLDSDQDGVVSSRDLLLWVAASSPGHTELNEADVLQWPEWKELAVQRFRSPTQRIEYEDAVSVLNKFDDLRPKESLAYGGAGKGPSSPTSAASSPSSSTPVNRNDLVDRVNELTPPKGLSFKPFAAALSKRPWEANMVLALHPVHEALIGSVEPLMTTLTAANGSTSSSSSADQSSPSSSSTAMHHHHHHSEEESVADYVLVKLRLMLDTAQAKDPRSKQCSELQRKMAEIKESALEYKKVTVSLTAGLRLHLLGMHRRALEMEDNKVTDQFNNVFSDSTSSTSSSTGGTTNVPSFSLHHQPSGATTSSSNGGGGVLFQIVVDPSNELGFKCSASLAVSSLVPGGQAEGQGVAVGCKILKVEEVSVKSRMDLKKALKSVGAKGEKTCTLELERPSPTPTSPSASPSTTQSPPLSPSSASSSQPQSSKSNLSSPAAAPPSSAAPPPPPAAAAVAAAVSSSSKTALPLSSTSSSSSSSRIDMLKPITTKGHRTTASATSASPSSLSSSRDKKFKPAPPSSFPKPKPPLPTSSSSSPKAKPTPPTSPKSVGNQKGSHKGKGSFSSSTSTSSSTPSNLTATATAGTAGDSGASGSFDSEGGAGLRAGRASVELEIASDDLASDLTLSSSRAGNNNTATSFDTGISGGASVGRGVRGSVLQNRNKALQARSFSFSKFQQQGISI